MDFKRFYQRKYYILAIVLLLIALTVNIVSLLNNEGEEFTNNLFNIILQFALVCYFVVRILLPYVKEENENIKEELEVTEEKEKLKI